MKLYGDSIVTGGLGFIGSHLIDTLIACGQRALVIDNLSSNAIVSDDCKAYVHIGSLTNVDSVKTKVIYHLAAPVGPVGVLKKAGEIGTLIINDIESAIKHALASDALLVYVSTSEIYGHTGILYEDSQKLFTHYSARSEYAAAKMLAEIMVTNTKDLRYQIIRPFNVAGPRQQPDGGFVLPRFVISALTHQPITVYGDGTQRRAFTDVRDIVSAILRIVDVGTQNDIWNIGNPDNESSIDELATRVIEAVGMGNVEYIDPVKLHGPNFVEAEDKIPNIDKLSSVCSWYPSFTFEQTLADTVQYYRTRRGQGYTYNVLEGQNLCDCRMRT